MVSHHSNLIILWVFNEILIIGNTFLIVLSILEQVSYLLCLLGKFFLVLERISLLIL